MTIGKLRRTAAVRLFAMLVVISMLAGLIPLAAAEYGSTDDIYISGGAVVDITDDPYDSEEEPPEVEEPEYDSGDTYGYGDTGEQDADGDLEAAQPEAASGDITPFSGDPDWLRLNYAINYTDAATIIIHPEGADVTAGQDGTVYNLVVTNGSTINSVDVYRVPHGTLHTITVTREVTVQAAPGAEIVLQMTASRRHFTVSTGGDFTIGGGSGTLILDGGADRDQFHRGGVRVQNASFNMHNGSVIRNSRASQGGGVQVSNSTFNMQGGEINGNTSVSSGGGVVMTVDSTFNMTGGEISGNTTVSSGGGVLVGFNCTFNMTGGEISGNTANTRGGGIGIRIDDLRAGRLNIGPGAVFANNTASGAFDRLAEDDVLYTTHIHATQWTQPFTQGFNNFDIEYTVIAEPPVQTRTLNFQLNGTPANPVSPAHIEPIQILPGTPILQARGFPNNPTRTGYGFAGWYLDSSTTQRVLPEMLMPDADTTIYARWVYAHWESAVVRFHFDGYVVSVGVPLGEPIDPALVPVPGRIYGTLYPWPSGRTTPGRVHVGWFATPNPNHFVHAPDRAVPFDLSQNITEAMLTDGVLELWGSRLQFGDVDGNGVVNLSDLAGLRLFLLEAITRYQIVYCAADLTGDGVVNLADLTMFQLYFLEHDVILGGPPATP